MASSTMEAPVLCFDLGGTKILGGVVSPQGEVLKLHKEYVDKSRGPEGLIEQITAIRTRLLSETAGELHSHVGFASAGPLDLKTGELLSPTNFQTQGQSWGRVPLRSELERLFEQPVVIENDAAAAARAEAWLGEGQGLDCFVMLTLGTGLGYAVNLGGQPLRDWRGQHPELSHMVMALDDPKATSPIGPLGTMEALSAGSHFAKRYSERVGESLRAEEIIQRARGGDPHAQEAMAEYAHAFSVVLYNAVILHAPQKIVLAGGFSSAADLFLPQAEQELRQHLERKLAVGSEHMPELRVSKIRKEAALLGAAHAALFRT